MDIAAPGRPAVNPAFDVTPARLVTAFITEAGVCAAGPMSMAFALVPDKATASSLIESATAWLRMQ